MSHSSDGLRLRGQSEPLTRRLKRLLDEYSDGLAVPKELLQNADDAGATEVTLVYDCRKNAAWCDAKSLIDPAMADCQGPALWAHNNATFSDADFDNILELSGATKLQQTAKVGRFGLGFNSVYNLTDVPCILSRHRMLVLDPHGERRDEGYLQTVYASRGDRDTGVEFDFLKDPDLMDRYRNQIAPFMGVCNCNLKATGGDFNGTLLRLALRTEIQAQKSKICDRVYSDTEMRALLRLAAEQADTLLLFTQTVRTFRCLYLPCNASNLSADMQLVFSVQKRPITYFLRHSLPLPPLPFPGVSQADQEFAAQSSTLKAAEVVLNEATSGSSRSKTPRETRTQMTLEVQLQLDESSRSHFQIGVAGATRVWLVCAAVGTGESLMLATEQRRLGLAPVGAVALLLDQSNRIVPLSRDSKPASLLFCFLPLPVENPFPVLLNGSFSVTSSRRHLTEVTVDEKQGVWSLGEWNRVLLTDVICRAYVDALNLLTRIQLMNADAVQQLWPRFEIATQAVWRPLIEKFYATVLDGQTPIFYTSAGWKSLSSAVFLDASVKDVGEMANCLVRLTRKLVSQSEGLASLDDGVWQTINQLQLQNRTLQRQWSGETLLLNFLREMSRLWQSGDREDCFEAIIFILDGSSSNWRLVCQMVTQNVRNLMKQLLCIPNVGGSLCQPSQLLDPLCLAGRLYSSNESVFPHQKLQNTNRLTALRSLGLRVDISWAEIMNRAQSIATLAKPQRLDRAATLLSYLDSCLGKFNHPLHQLGAVQFLPAVRKPVGCCFAWLSDGCPLTQLFQPAQLFEPDCQDLVSATQLVLDKSVLRDLKTGRIHDLLTRIGVLNSNKISAEAALQQLVTVARTNAANNETLRVCQCVYRHLSVMISSGKPTIRGTRNFVMQESELCIVWSPAKFLRPAQVTKNSSDHDFPPHLYILSMELNDSQYLPFLNAAGVAERFTSKHFLGVLQELKQRYYSVALTNSDRELCIKLLEKIDDKVGAELKDIYAPDQSGVLRPCTQLCFNNLPWMQSVQLPNDTYFCHKDVSYGLCERLGIPDQRDSMLSQAFQPLPFGQHEDLTTRLKNIIAGYPLGSELFKELIQNADDAGASKICFVIDHRDHGTEKVFSDNWRELQGPALLVYNDSVFTEADIAGIQNLGSGSKQDEAWKTGQYGIGFNCVYNITDVPSFLSDDRVLCVMDPHCEYMPGANPATPGGMFKELVHIKEAFPDVFAAFLPEHLRHTGGTLFRLPLRRKASAGKSKICTKVVNSADIRALFYNFQNELARTVLFLTSVREIHLCEVTSAGKFATVFGIKTSIRCVSGNVDHYSDQCKVASNYLITTGAQLGSTPPSYVTYELTITNVDPNVNTQQKWLITKQLGCPVSVPEQLQSHVASEKWRLLPKVGVAAPISEPSVAMRTGQVYCLLPLPLTTALPVNIDGHFILDPSRRSLWKADGKEDCKEQWNILLATQLMADCFGSLLKAFATCYAYCPGTIDGYFRLFPVLDNREKSLWRELIASFFQNAFVKRWDIFPIFNGAENVLQWLPLAQGNDDINGSAGFLMPHGMNHFLQKLMQELRYPMIVPDRMALLQSLDSCNLPFLPAANSQSIAAFLRGPVCESLRASLPQGVGETPFHNAESVVQLMEYLLKDLSDNLEELRGTPLKLSAGDRLTIFGQGSPLYLTEFSDLFSFSEARHEFAHSRVYKAFCSESYRARLTGTSGLFAKFQLRDFVCILSRERPSVFSTDKIFVAESDFHMKSDQLSKWLNRVWEFLALRASESAQEQLNAAGVGNCHLIPVDGSRCVRVALAPCIYQPLLAGIDGVSSGVQCALKELNCPACSAVQVNLVATLCGNVRKSESMMRVFEFALAENPERSNVTEKQAVNILLYIQHNWQQLSSSQGEEILANRIRRLPLFVMSDGRCCALDSAQACILPATLLGDEMDQWKGASQAIFLKCSFALNALYKELCCDEMSEPEVYARFIIPAFSRLSEQTRKGHLERLRNLSWQFDGIRYEKLILFNQLQAALKLADLIPVNGGWKPVGSFYDDQFELFNDVFSSKHFLPAPYDSEEWRALMKMAGLITECSSAEAIRIAQKLASDGLSGPTDMLQEKSQKLLEFVDGIAFGKERTESVIMQMAGIAFVVADSDASLRRLCERSDIPVSMVSLNQCCLYADRYLCWTEVPYAPECIRSTSHFVKFMRGFRDKDFLLHFAALFTCKTFMSPDLVKEESLRWQVMRRIYTKLSEFLAPANAESAHLISIMKDVPCVLIRCGDRSCFVSANRITFDNKSEILPYTFVCPEELAVFKMLFIHLGATESATIEQMRFVLEMMHSEQGTKLNEPQLRSVGQCVSNVVALLERGEKFSFSSSMTLFLTAKAASSGDSAQQPAYILADCRQLTISDSRGFHDRLIDSNGARFLDLEFCKLGTDKLRCLYLRLSEDLNVPKISSAVAERLLSDSNAICDDGDGCEIRSYLEAKLHNPVLHQCIIGIILHNSTDPTVRGDNKMKMVTSLISSLSIVCLSKLRTCLLLNGEVQPDSEADKSFFFEGKRILINHSLVPDVGAEEYKLWQMDFTKLVLDILQTGMHLSQQQESWISDVLLMDKPENMLKVLEKLNISEYEAGEQHSDLPSFSDEELGSVIPELDQCRLQQLPASARDLRNRLVAYKTPSGELVYTKVLERHGGSDGNPWNEEFTIDTGSGYVRVKASQIFEFEEHVREVPANASESTGQDLRRTMDQLLSSAAALPTEQQRQIFQRIIAQYSSSDEAFNEVRAQAANHGWSEQFNDQVDPWREDAVRVFRYRKVFYVEQVFEAYTTRRSGGSRSSFPRRQTELVGFAGPSQRTAQMPNANANAEQGGRYLKTARDDLRSAACLAEAAEYNWACYISWQAAEKALKAAILSHGQTVECSHQLTQHLRCIGGELHNRLLQHVSNLAAALIDDCRYPSDRSRPKVPSQVFGADEAAQAVQSAESVVACVTASIFTA